MRHTRRSGARTQGRRRICGERTTTHSHLRPCSPRRHLHTSNEGGEGLRRSTEAHSAKPHFLRISECSASAAVAHRGGNHRASKAASIGTTHAICVPSKCHADPALSGPTSTAATRPAYARTRPDARPCYRNLPNPLSRQRVHWRSQTATHRTRAGGRVRVLAAARHAQPPSCCLVPSVVPALLHPARAWIALAF